jgi:hypothetical protein
MNRERAETYLRLLAEAELGRAMRLRADSPRGSQGVGPAPGHSMKLAQVAQALSTVHAIEAGLAEKIKADLDLALAMRLPRELGRPGPRGHLRARMMMGHQPAPPGAYTFSGLGSRRVVPVGQVIRIRAYDTRGELCLLAYTQTADSAWFTVSGWVDGLLDGSPTTYGPRPGPAGLTPQEQLAPAAGPPTLYRQFTATDDQGVRYQLSFSGGQSGGDLEGVLHLRPDPSHEIRWLDLSTTPGEAATRINLDPRDPPPDVTVTQSVASPGEFVLNGIAARMLATEPGPLSRAAGGLGDVVAALQAAGALSPSSPVPGQLARLCVSLGISGHHITAPLAGELPEPWLSVLTYYYRGKPAPAHGLGTWATVVAELPELDGARIAILGLHQNEHDTIVHMLAGGVVMEPDGPQTRGFRPWPVLWIRGSGGGWHTTRLAGMNSKEGGAVMLRLAMVPPLARGDTGIEVIATGQSAEVRACLPLRWI